jgi:hypothetical protein
MVPLADSELGPVADTVRQTHDRLKAAKPRRILEIMWALIKRHKQDQKGRSDTEWEAIAHEYVEDLGKFSEEHILGAIREYRRGNKWFPHQSELIEICERLVAIDTITLRRGQVLLGQAEPYRWERLPAPDTEDRKVFDIAPALAALGRGKSVRPVGAPQAKGPDKAEVLASRDPDAVEQLAKLREPRR